MSGIKSPELQAFYRSLHARGLDVRALAEQLKLSRGAVTRVICGLRRRGPIWAKLAPLLTEHERALLDVEHRATWNKRAKKRPAWTEDLAQQLQRSRVA